MKLAMRNWQWLVGLSAAGLIGATSYLMAQIQTAPAGIGVQANGTAAVKVSRPDARETADAARLIDAINAGDIQTAVKILRAYKVADDTLLAMAGRLGKTPARVELPEPFLKASVGALTTMDQTDVKVRLQDATATLDYERPVWVPRWVGSRTIASHDAELMQCPVAPVVVLNVETNEPCFIRYFNWYDRYAEKLHSVVLNGASLSNASLDAKNYDQANRVLNALFQLVKARKPDAFVWLSVVKEDDRSDEQWLRGMSFQPDGLQISNLRQFHSPFAETRARYVAIVGPDMPMMVSGFCGYTAALQAKGKKLRAALANTNRPAAQADEAAVTAQLGNIGAAAGQDLAQVETNLLALGYRGISVHWLLLTALATPDKATQIDRSDLPDPRVGLLDSCLRNNDYGRVFSLAAEMLTNSAPGDMDWTAAKLAEGMAWLKQTPPDPERAIPVLDEVLAVDFKNRPGRDHYVITAARWRMYAAVLCGDMKKSQALAQWVQDQPFRKDLKADFLKEHWDLVSQPANPSK